MPNRKSLFQQKNREPPKPFSGPGIFALCIAPSVIRPLSDYSNGHYVYRSEFIPVLRIRFGQKVTFCPSFSVLNPVCHDSGYVLKNIVSKFSPSSINP